MTTEETAIVRAQTEAIAPTTFAEAEAFANAIAKSALVPEKLRQRAADVLFVVLAGRELGLAPLSSMRVMHIIEGTPRLSADGLAAVVTRAAVCRYLRRIESTDTTCTWETHRVGHETPTRTTWTKERAVRAGLWDRNNRDGSPGMWKKYPERMLSARAKAELCRDVYPEIAAGLVTVEEVDDMDAPIGAPVFTAPPTPAPAPTPEPAKRGRPPKTPPAETTTPDLVSGPPASAKPAGDPTSGGPSTNGAPPPDKRSSDVAPASTSSNPPPSDVDAFDDEPAPAMPPPPARTMDGFRGAVLAAKTGAEMNAVKTDWLAWSKDESATGGKQHAVEMRTIFAAKARELEAGAPK